MKRYYIIIALAFSSVLKAQDYKEDISVVQFSAEFVKSAEIDLKEFKDCNTYTFYIEKNKGVFDKEKIKYLPTILIFQNGKEIMREETGISMKFAEGTAKKILKEVEELIESKF